MRKEPEYRPQGGTNGEDIPLMEQLRQYQRAGVEITLEDVRLPLEDIAKICAVKEKGAYMCDFIADEHDYIVRLNFERVKNREEGSCEENAYSEGLCDKDSYGKDL